MKLFLTFLFSLTILSTSFSQRSCGSHQKMNDFLLENPNLKNKRDKIEQQILSTHYNHNKQSMTIPVVFHVLYNTNSQNISDSQILSQLDVLNADFNRTNSDAFSTPSDFDSIVTSLQLNFCLATKTADGNATNGIIRTHTNINSFPLYDSSIHYTNMGGDDAWDTEKYLNIWICNIGGGILGWAQFPDAGSSNTDGVVIDYLHFGTNGTAISPYNLGRTATHEVGHYFNLFHTWGDNNCGNDWVNDTPIQEEANFGCKTHPSISCSNNGDMFMNFMDYTDDDCMNSFTIGQRDRVWQSINLYRLPLLTSDGCETIISSNSDASIEIISPNGTLYGCNNPIYPKVLISNNSTTNLTTAIIKYKINSSNYHYQYWNGNLSTNQSDSVLLSGIAVGGNNHIIEVELLLPNNNTDINIFDNSDTKLFNTSGGTNVSIHLITDNYANETSWYFLDENNNIIDSSNSVTNNHHYEYNYCLENNCYKFIINDSEGDGFCCNYGNGNISINKEINNQEIANLSFFNYTDTIYFCVTELSLEENKKNLLEIHPNPTSGIIHVKSSNFTVDIPIIAKVFDLKGRNILTDASIGKTFNFSELQNGIYILELEQNKVLTKSKLIINK